MQFYSQSGTKCYQGKCMHVTMVISEERKLTSIIILLEGSLESLLREVTLTYIFSILTCKFCSS